MWAPESTARVDVDEVCSAVLPSNGRNLGRSPQLCIAENRNARVLRNDTDDWWQRQLFINGRWTLDRRLSAGRPDLPRRGPYPSAARLRPHLWCGPRCRLSGCQRLCVWAGRSAASIRVDLGELQHRAVTPMLQLECYSWPRDQVARGSRLEVPRHVTMPSCSSAARARVAVMRVTPANSAS